MDAMTIKSIAKNTKNDLYRTRDKLMLSSINDTKAHAECLENVIESAGTLARLIIELADMN